MFERLKLLNALVARPTDAATASTPAPGPEDDLQAQLPRLNGMARAKSKRALPRSVCTTLKDLCEL